MVVVASVSFRILSDSAERERHICFRRFRLRSRGRRSRSRIRSVRPCFRRRSRVRAFIVVPVFVLSSPFLSFVIPSVSAFPRICRRSPTSAWRGHRERTAPGSSSRSCFENVRRVRTFFDAFGFVATFGVVVRLGFSASVVASSFASTFGAFVRPRRFRSSSSWRGRGRTYGVPASAFVRRAVARRGRRLRHTYSACGLRPSPSRVEAGRRFCFRRAGGVEASPLLLSSRVARRRPRLAPPSSFTPYGVATVSVVVVLRRSKCPASGGAWGRAFSLLVEKKCDSSSRVVIYRMLKKYRYIIHELKKVALSALNC